MLFPERLSVGCFAYWSLDNGQFAFTSCAFGRRRLVVAARFAFVVAGDIRGKLVAGVLCCSSSVSSSRSTSVNATWSNAIPLRVSRIGRCIVCDSLFPLTRSTRRK